MPRERRNTPRASDKVGLQLGLGLGSGFGLGLGLRLGLVLVLVLVLVLGLGLGLGLRSSPPTQYASECRPQKPYSEAYYSLHSSRFQDFKTHSRFL